MPMKIQNINIWGHICFRVCVHGFKLTHCRGNHNNKHGADSQRHVIVLDRFHIARDAM